jgi:DNA-binding SARP family transcriptional activator
VLEIRLLGPLEVVDGDRVLTPHRQKPRALLAVLALRAGRHVSKDLLVELIWGQDPPRRAMDALENYVSQLRKLIGRDAIETRAGAYRLTASPEQVDVTRFEQLIAQARGAGDEERAERIRAALTLFRGPPLADLAYEPFAATEIGRLEELELTAREDFVDAELELGRHTDVIPELEVLIAGHPYRERPRAQLMLALYRAGRQAEALEAFHEARRLLVDELGLEPGAELQELERAILRQDESLRARARLERAAPALPPPASRRTLRKTVAILVSELAGATALAERLDPELLRAVLDGYLAAVRGAVARHGGAVGDEAGEAVTAVFGVPATHEDDALRAVRAAVEAREAVAALNDELLAGKGAYLEPRIGLAGGEVLVTGETVPTGRAVGRARELARRARAGQILLDEGLRSAVRDATSVEPAEEEAAHRVVELLPGADGRALRLDAPFVGRARQAAALAATFDAALEERSCRLFTVLGAAGVGKSRLVQELLESVDDRATVGRGRCLPYGEGITYLPLQEALAAAAADVDWSAPPEHLFPRVRAVLEERARAQPVVLTLDDIHWAEPAFLDLVEDVARTSRGVPLLVVCLGRSELLDDRPGWGGGLPNASSLLLEPLGEADTERLLDHLLGASELPDPVRSYIVGAAEGNPLFLEELLASLVESDVLQRQSGRWTTTESVIRVPPSISALIAARIDRLADDDRLLLELASVEGVHFSRDVLAELVPESLRPDLTGRVDGLVRRELVRHDEAGRFRFRHQLIREAAYASMTKQDRAEHHERLADVLEAEGVEPDVLAYHRERAGRYRAELALGRGHA